MKTPTLAAALMLTGLLVGCSPQASPSATSTTPGASVTTRTPTPTPTPTSKWTGEEAKIEAQLIAFNDWAGKAYTDPSVKASDVALYTWDEDPDYVMTALQRALVTFRLQGYKQTGVATASVQWIKAGTGGTYTALTCTDSTNAVVTDKNGAVVNNGPKIGAAGGVADRVGLHVGDAGDDRGALIRLIFDVCLISS